MTKVRLPLVMGVAGTTRAITQTRSKREMHNRGEMVFITTRGPTRVLCSGGMKTAHGQIILNEFALGTLVRVKLELEDEYATPI